MLLYRDITDEEYGMLSPVEKVNIMQRVDSHFMVPDPRATAILVMWEKIESLLVGRVDAHDIRHWSLCMTEREWGLLPAMLMLIADALEPGP